MDTSEKYIRMCKAAKEIQKQKPREHDECSVYRSLEEEPYCPSGCYVESYGGGTYCSNCGKKIQDREIFEECDCDSEGAIWLPRQDQLQLLVDFQEYEKAACGWCAPCVRVVWFYDWINTELKKYDSLWRYHLYPIEQLWLMFVMKERYNKIWEEEKWKKKRS